MTTPKYDVRRCTRETLERFAEWWLSKYPDDHPSADDPVRRLRSEARVRTRAEIDREIGDLLRKNCTEHGEGSDCLPLDTVGKRLRSLAHESATAPEEP